MAPARVLCSTIIGVTAQFNYGYSVIQPFSLKGLFFFLYVETVTGGWEIHTCPGEKILAACSGEQSPRGWSRVTAFMPCVSRHFKQENEAIIPSPQDLLFASTTSLHGKFTFKSVRFFYLDIKNQN